MVELGPGNLKVKSSQFSKETLNQMANFIPSLVFTKEKNYQ